MSADQASESGHDSTESTAYDLLQPDECVSFLEAMSDKEIVAYAGSFPAGNHVSGENVEVCIPFLNLYRTHRSA